VNLLAIETATTACAVGLATADGVTSRVGTGERQHTEQLMPLVVALLADAGCTLAELDRVVVDRGPGLFTGMRVGLATAAALAQANQAEIVGVTSLELYAHGAAAAGVRGTVLALVDGRRGEVFAQEFLVGDEVVAVAAPQVTTATSLLVTWGTSGAPATVIGDGVQPERTLLASVPNFTLVDVTVPPVREALRLGATRPTGDVLPLYLREADAVANFEVRTRG
jgi:tRNA threonylcarbamoyladenosine biosynthesis protein TsaB